MFNLRLFMHGRKALTIDDTSESTSVLTLNPENQENQQSIHYARNESYGFSGIPMIHSL